MRFSKEVGLLIAPTFRVADLLFWSVETAKFLYGTVLRGYITRPVGCSLAINLATEIPITPIQADNRTCLSEIASHIATISLPTISST